MDDKRGISPLIATLLLIAFTVALGVMIIQIGGNIVGEVAECESVKLEVPVIEGQPAFCYQESAESIKIILRNAGEGTIAKISFSSIDADLQLVKQDIEDSSIAPGDVIQKTISYQRSGQSTIDLVPFVGSDGGEKACPDQTLTIKNLVPCSS